MAPAPTERDSVAVFVVLLFAVVFFCAAAAGICDMWECSFLTEITSNAKQEAECVALWLLVSN